MLSETMVPDSVATYIINKGFSTASLFAYAFLSAQQLEDFIAEMITTDGNIATELALTNLNWPTSPCASAIRRVWHEAFSASQQNSYSPGSSHPSQPMEWADSLPPKLTQDQIREMQETFERNYPGELLDDDSLPGTRLWSMVFDQLRPGGKMRWIPWTQILSVRQEAEIQAAKSRRAPRSELALLGQLCWDDPPSLSEEDLRPSPWRIERMMRVRRNAYALSGGCHLHNFKMLDEKVLAMFVKTFPAESGLRAPSLKELIDADKHILSEAFKLVSDRSWALDDALHELSTVRTDLSVWLQPRPKPPQTQQPKGAGKGKSQQFGERPPPPRKGDRSFGKGKSKDKGQKGKPGDRSRSRVRLLEGWQRDWPLHLNINGVQTPICMRFNVSECSNTSCRFAHKCPIPDSSGNPCGGSHRAIDCPSGRRAPRL